MLFEVAVEKGMRRALVDHQLVRNAGAGQLAVELGEVLLRGGLVVASEEQQEWRAHLRDDIADARWDPVKADGA